MINNLFSLKYSQISTDGWDAKKPRLISLLRDSEFERQGAACFDTDRHNNGRRYVQDFCEIFNEELNRFGMELGAKQLRIDAIWAVRYDRGDYHTVHNHRSKGWSGILYVDYDETVHTPSIHVAPWNDPLTDTTQQSAPQVREGSFVFVPSCVLHFTRPNQSDKLRQIVAFDMEIE